VGQSALRLAAVSILALTLHSAAARAGECDVVTAKIVAKTGAAFTGANADGLKQFSLIPYRGLLGCRPAGNNVRIYSDDYPSPQFLEFASTVGSLAVGVPASSLRTAIASCRDEYLRDPSFFPQHDVPGAHIQCGGPGFFVSADGLRR
jgi:hypothetical protein